MIEIIKLRKGFCEEGDLSFSEIAFSSGDSEYWVIAMSAGEMDFYLCAAEPLIALADEMGLAADWDFEVAESGEGQDSGSGVQTISLEELLAALQESDLEHYECWRNDGGEGLPEMAGSEHANEFLITYHFHSLLESPDASALNKQLDYYCEMVNKDLDDLIEGLELK